LAVSKVSNTEKSIEEQVEEDIAMANAVIEDSSYDCKYLDENKSNKFKANDTFTLCAPMISRRPKFVRLWCIIVRDFGICSTVIYVRKNGNVFLKICTVVPISAH
jgi:hypothetical protein